MRLGTMPLPVDVQTLPLYLWERASGVALDIDADFDTILPWMRRGNLVFWWLLLFFTHRVARALGGPWAGRLAVALVVVEPSLLGHACLATTDISITAIFLPCLYFFWKGRDAAGWWPRIGLPALWYGALVLAKASGMVYAPLAMAVIEVHRLATAGAYSGWRQNTWRLRATLLRNSLRPCVHDGLRIVGWGLLLVFVYVGSDWQPERSFHAWAHSLSEGWVKTVMVSLAESLRLFPNAAIGLARQIKHNLKGHPTYLLGMESKRAIWFYFPVLILIKLSLPLLVMPVVLAVTRRRALLNWAMLCCLALLAASLNFRVQLGIRMVLPMVALGIVGLACALAVVLRDLRHSRRFALLAGVAACLVWTGASAVRVWPHGIAYTNECWGNTKGGYLYVSDSNYDWGQGIKDLKRWQAARSADHLAVWYFGEDPELKRTDWEVLELHIDDSESEIEFYDKVRGKYLAVSATRLYGGYPEKNPLAGSLLRRLEPVARTQTFLIYDFTRADMDLARAASR